MTARAARTTEAMTEAQLMECLIQAARTLGFLVYHDRDSRRNEPGFPDLIIVGHGYLFAWECKTAKGRIRPATITKRGRVLPGQDDWLNAIEAAQTVGTMVVRPQTLDYALTVLQIVAEQQP